MFLVFQKYFSKPLFWYKPYWGKALLTKFMIVTIQLEKKGFIDSNPPIKYLLLIQLFLLSVLDINVMSYHYLFDIRITCLTPLTLIL